MRVSVSVERPAWGATLCDAVLDGVYCSICDRWATLELQTTEGSSTNACADSIKWFAVRKLSRFFEKPYGVVWYAKQTVIRQRVCTPA